MNKITLTFTSSISFKNYCKKRYEEYVKKQNLPEESKYIKKIKDSYINLNFNALVVDYINDYYEEIIDIKEEKL